MHDQPERYVMQAIACAAAAVLLWSCSETRNECASHDDCQKGFTCDTLRGNCSCASDAACGAGRLCAATGNCRPIPPCHGNTDCPAGFICDSADPEGACIPDTTCGSSADCDFGAYCDAVTATCEPGCRDTSDCPLGFVCDTGACVDGRVGNDCALCPTDLDAGIPGLVTRYCDYGELCGNDGVCTLHAEASQLCLDCTGSNTCPAGFVCVSDRDASGTSYCAPQCQSEIDCPSGFAECSGLIIIQNECPIGSWCTNGLACVEFIETETSLCQCASAAECGAQPTCTNDLCPGGARCTSDADCAVACLPRSNGPETVQLCETAYKVCRKERGITCSEILNGVAPCAR
ncbi:MAG: hypothetical protein HYZ27_00095 [Deltaproteobacteria bacterium]|nr:hypothetical protein [Deltaproteobacteria bacterium]